MIQVGEGQVGCNLGLTSEGKIRGIVMDSKQVQASKFTTESHKLLQGDVGELFL